MARQKQGAAQEQAHLRAAGYARVSTREQADGGHSLGEQERTIRAYVKQRGWLSAGVYVDPGCSGSNLQRPGLQALLEAVQAKQVDVVIACHQDRLSRSALDLLTLREIFNNPPNLVLIREQIDTTTPAGRMLFTMMAAVAEHFLDMLRENTRNGMAEAKRQGHVAGRAPFGWRRENGLLVRDSEEQKALRKARRLRSSGKTLRAVAEVMGWTLFSTTYRLGYRKPAQAAL